MEIICVSNKAYIRVTIGKSYETKDFLDRSIFCIIRDDKNISIFADKADFITREEYREKRINELL